MSLLKATAWLTVLAAATVAGAASGWAAGGVVATWAKR